MSKQKQNAKKPAANKAAGKNKSVNVKPAKNTVQTAKTKKEKIALLERMIAALQNRLKKLKRDSSLARNEFRYNNQTRHPNYVFEEESGKYHSLGITHGEQTFGKKNMPLKQNPKKGEEKPAYIRNGIITDKKSNYSKKPIKNMQFENSDFSNVKSKIRNYKKQRKKAQKKTGSERR